MGHIKNRMREAFDAARRANGLTQRQVAAAIGVTPQAVNGWFSTGRITKSNLAAFAKIVGIDFEYLAADAKVIDEEPGATGHRRLTKMGERIVDLMKIHGLNDRDSFAAAIGLTSERFSSWLFVDQRSVEARPLLRCADALSTNPEYLLGDSDDIRAQDSLGWREHQLVSAFRELSEEQQDLLLKTASAWHQQAQTAPSAAGPFRTNGSKGPKE